MSDDKKPSDWSVEYKDWDPAQPLQSLNDLFGSSIALVNAQIDWYRWRSKWLKKASKTCRLLGIMFGAIGTLIPLFQVAWNALQTGGATNMSWLGQWGYVAFGLAATALFWDRIFGFSSSWIRFIKAQLALEEARTELNYDWRMLMAKFAARPGSDEQVQAMVQRLKDFAKKVHAEVRQETEAWVTEFQSNLAELEKFSKAQAEERRPGKLQVTVTNARDFQQGIKVWLDQTESRDIEGTECLFVFVPPGEHQIKVVGKKQDGTERTASKVTTIRANALTTESFTLPV